MKDLLRSLEEAMWSDDDIRYAFDANPDLTMSEGQKRKVYSPREKIKTHQGQYWWYRDLDFIMDGPRSFAPVGSGRLEIPAKRAGQLKKLGYIEIEDHRMGKRASLTSKGRKAWRQAQDAFDEI